MSRRDDGGTAFPMQDAQAAHAYASVKVAEIDDAAERDKVYIRARAEAVRGMSLRDYFAAGAMQGFAADPNTTGEPALIAKVAYQWADAMLAERKKP